MSIRSDFRKILAMLLIIALFAAFNLGVYILFTMRLTNNFGSAAQAKMIDVVLYLPHEESSLLPDFDASLQLNGDLPVLDGAAALVPVYAAIIHNTYPAGSVSYEGGIFSADNFYGENFANDSAMQYNNTVRGFTSLVDGETDIFFTAAPSAGQRAYAAEQGVELVYVPIGLEAFVFFVNINNPVDGLTVDQVRGIYSGEITGWHSLGGPNRAINPVTRLSGSGSQSAMEAFMGDTPFGKKSPLAIGGASIGYSFRYYMDGMVGSDSVKMIALNGVYPSTENIRNGKYPVVIQFYAVYRAENTNKNVTLLIDWLLSEEGQRLIEMCGYIGIR